MSDTLVLNADGNPLSLLAQRAVNWHLSIKLIWLDKFKILENYDDWILHSPNRDVCSSVLMACEYVSLHGIRFPRNNVYQEICLLALLWM